VTTIGAKRLGIALAVGGALLLFVGVTVFEASSLFADEDTEYLGNPEQLTVYPERKTDTSDPLTRWTPTSVPRPDESRAQSIEAAKEELSAQPDLAQVIAAAEAGDVDTLLGLARSGNFCSREWRMSETPDECKEPGSVVPGIHMEAQTGGVESVLMPADSMREWLEAILTNQPVQLTLVAREATDLGRYYFVFKAAESAESESLGSGVDSVGIVVLPGESEPIQWFQFLPSSDKGLQWLQTKAGETSLRFDLIAPESVKDWPDIWGETGK
jgi:hypothetical protein